MKSNQILTPKTLCFRMLLQRSLKGERIELEAKKAAIKNDL